MALHSRVPFRKSFLYSRIEVWVWNLHRISSKSGSLSPSTQRPAWLACKREGYQFVPEKISTFACLFLRSSGRLTDVCLVSLCSGRQVTTHCAPLATMTIAKLGHWLCSCRVLLLLLLRREQKANAFLRWRWKHRSQTGIQAAPGAPTPHTPPLSRNRRHQISSTDLEGKWRCYYTWP